MNSPSDVESFAKALLALVALAGAIWPFFKRWLRYRKHQREMRALESKVLRYLVDAIRHVLDAITPSADGRITTLTELTRQLILIDGVRRELWQADGHQADVLAEEVRNVLTRTQAIKILKQRSTLGDEDMFKSDDVESGVAKKKDAKNA